MRQGRATAPGARACTLSAVAHRRARRHSTVGRAAGAGRNPARRGALATSTCSAHAVSGHVAAPRIEVRREDFRIKQFSQRRESTIIFCVDASGSAAFHRLAEAKGAVELLLGEAYVARTYAALIAFRGAGADVLLPPSRSLTRAKALLSTLPGGGGTPLAAGIDAAIRHSAGRAREGPSSSDRISHRWPGKYRARRTGGAQRCFCGRAGGAAPWRRRASPRVFIDTAQRAREEGRKLAGAMGARYLALPHVEAARSARLRARRHAMMRCRETRPMAEWRGAVGRTGPPANLSRRPALPGMCRRWATGLCCCSFTAPARRLIPGARWRPCWRSSLKLSRWTCRDTVSPRRRRTAPIALLQMAAALAALLDVLDVAPDYVAGHSAGAAIAIRMAIDRPHHAAADYRPERGADAISRHRRRWHFRHWPKCCFSIPSQLHFWPGEPATQRRWSG